MLRKIPIFILFLVFITLFMASCENNNQQVNEAYQLKIQYHLDEDVIEVVDDIENYEFYTPLKEGHEFMGWYLDLDLTIALTKNKLPKKVEQDTIIDAYPEWYVMNYKVEFYSGNKLLKTESVAYLKSATAPTPKIIPGYRFAGWDADFSEVKDNLKVNAIYEENNESDTIIVVLGNYLNDNGTISETLRTRLELALSASELYLPAYIVLSGGMANKAAGITEAFAMEKYLINKGIDQGILIKEERSLSTYQNAIYTIQILEEFTFSKLVIVSTIEHFTYYETLKYFNDAINENSILKTKNIEVIKYTNE